MEVAANVVRSSFHPSVSPALVSEQRALEELEAKITEHRGYINAATYHFLCMIAEFDRRKGHERHGLVSTAQWLNWQCGIQTATAREKVRTARALEHLPKISASFAKGEISYSKVRAMTRVATPANEPALLQIALHGTASHVEKLVGRYEWTKRASAAQDAQMRYSERAVHYYYEMGNTLVVHARLPRDIGALVVNALQVASDIVREAAKPTDVSAEPSMQLTLRPEGVKR